MKMHIRTKVQLIRKLSVAVSVLMLTSLLFCPAAQAHKASIFAWVQGTTIHTQSKMMGGKRPNQALVEVFDENGLLLLQGKTDVQGLFSFPAPQKSNLKIVLNAGAGHRAVWSLTPHDFIEETSESVYDHTHEDAVHTKPLQPGPSNKNINPLAPDILTRDEIATLVASTLDQKLTPVMAKLAEMDQKQINLSDIVAGLGYIMGLVGLAAYMHYRRKTRDESV